MDKINFNQTGGLPLSTNVLDNMQEAYKIFNQFANIFSKKATKNIIVAGCNIAGNTASEGFVIIDNELLPFAGGTVQEYVYIKNVPVKRSFKDGTEKEVETKRTVHFGTDPDGNGRKWEDFVTLLSLAEMDSAFAEIYNSRFPQIYNDIENLNSTLSQADANLGNRITALTNSTSQADANLGNRITALTNSTSQADANLGNRITDINNVLLKSKVIIEEIDVTDNAVGEFTINHGLDNNNIILYLVETKMEGDNFWRSHQDKNTERRDNKQIHVINIESFTMTANAAGLRFWIRVNIIYKAN